MLFNGCRIYVWEYEKVLKMEGSNGWAGMWIGLTMSKLENGEAGKFHFMLYSTLMDKK